MMEKLQAAATFVKEQFGETIPTLALILGSGLGSFPSSVDIIKELPYSEIPNHPVSTVVGHEGKLLLAAHKESGKRFLIMQGRVHFYEGYSMYEVVFPVRMFALLGVKTLLVTNAAGGVYPAYDAGDLMIIEDHLNMMGTNPLIGANFEQLGPRFPDMSKPYSTRLINLINGVAKKQEISIRCGIYAGMTGPSFETPSEIFYFRKIGGDTVGMSTVPEVVIARHMDIPCFAISVITDLGVPGKIKKVTHEDVQNVAEVTEPKLTLLIKNLISKI